MTVHATASALCVQVLCPINTFDGCICHPLHYTVAVVNSLCEPKEEDGDVINSVLVMAAGVCNIQ